MYKQHEGNKSKTGSLTNMIKALTNFPMLVKWSYIEMCRDSHLCSFWIGYEDLTFHIGLIFFSHNTSVEKAEVTGSKSYCTYQLNNNIVINNYKA